MINPWLAFSFRYDGSQAALAHANQFREEYPKFVQQQAAKLQPRPDYDEPREKPRGHSRSKRQAPQHAQQYQEPRPQYSYKLPDTIQQLLKFQAQIPYDIIANQIQARPDKPYVPQPVHAQEPQQVQQQYQQQQQPQYQQPTYNNQQQPDQRDNYRHAYQPRPVNERQY